MSWLSRLFGKSASSDKARADRAASESAIPAEKSEVLEFVTVELAALQSHEGKSTSPADIDRDIDIFEARYLTSLSATDFLVALEREYGVLIPIYHLGGKCSTVASLADYIVEESESKR